MTLACKTADLLSLATQVLKHLLSGQDTLVSADERKFALTQLATAVQAAAQLADVVHMEAQGAGGTGVGAVEDEAGGQKADANMQEQGREIEKTQRIKAETEKSVAETARFHAEARKVGMETERAKAEAQKAGKQAERAVAETERLKAEAMMVRSVKLKIDAETEREKVGRELQLEAQKADEEAERAVAETERLKAEAMMVPSVKLKIDAETDREEVGREPQLEAQKTDEEAERAVSETQRLTVETGQTSAEEKRVGEGVESSGQVEKGHGQKPRRTLEVIYEELEQEQIEMTDGNPPRWPQLTQKTWELKLEALNERLGRIST